MNFSNHCFSCISQVLVSCISLLCLHSKHFIVFLLIASLTSGLFGSVLILSFFWHGIYFLTVSVDWETKHSLIGSLASHEVAFLVLTRVAFLPEVWGSSSKLPWLLVLINCLQTLDWKLSLFSFFFFLPNNQRPPVALRDHQQFLAMYASPSW